MKGNGGQVQTVSIIATISELAISQRSAISQLTTGQRSAIKDLDKRTAITSEQSAISHSQASPARNQSPGDVSVRSSRNQSPGGSTRFPLNLPPSPPSGPRSHPPPPPLKPRSPRLTVPTTLSVTNASSAMSKPPARNSLPHQSMPHQSPTTVNGHSMTASMTKLERLNVSAIVRPNFDEFTNGLSKNQSQSVGYLNSTMRQEGEERRRRRVKKMGVGKRVGRGQGQTPDWIRDIFGIAKKGNLDQLKDSLSEMEVTLVRNLSDHGGNNLLHIVCAQGHAHILPWLSARLGPELDSALSDENKQGLTPSVVAVKHGRQEIIFWLVSNTRVRERLSSRDGERCLLHAAAKYGQDSIASWLSEEMMRDGLELDQMDLSGDTPLHLAARAGRTKTAVSLLNLGASVNMKNDMGLKPGDVARAKGEDSTAEYLLMFETSLGITKELLQKDRATENLAQEHGELKGHFKDVLSVSKKLAKEREDMCSQLGRLHESMIELHDKMIMEMQVMAQENSSLRKNGLKQEDCGSEVEATIEMCDSLHDRWQQQQRQWFSSNLADLEHRIMLAEDGWKKVKAGTASPPVEHSYSQRHLRDRLEEVRAQSSSLGLGASRFSSSCSGESDSSPEASDHDDIVTVNSEDTNFYEAMRTPTKKPNMASRKKLATPSPSHRKAKNASDQSINESMYSSLNSPVYSTIGSPVDKGMGHADVPDGDIPNRGSGMDYNRAKTTASDLAKVMGLTPEKIIVSKAARKKSREDLKKRLKELALVSESGSASVLEVIEPNSSEEEEFKKSMQEMNISWSRSSPKPGGGSVQAPAAMHKNKRHSLEPLPSPAPSLAQSRSSESSSSVVGSSRTSSLEKNRTLSDQPSSKRGDQSPTKRLSEMGISAPSMGLSPGRAQVMQNIFVSNKMESNRISQLTDSKNLLTSEPDILQGIKGIRQDATPEHSLINNQSLCSQDNSRENLDLIDDEFADEIYDEDFLSDVQMLPYDLESNRSESSMQVKKKGFLQKLSLRTKWAGKKKGGKGNGKVKEIAPEYFRETYGTSNGNNVREITIQEIPPTGKSLEPMESVLIEVMKSPSGKTKTLSGNQEEDVTASSGKHCVTISVANGEADISTTMENHNMNHENQESQDELPCGEDPPVDTRVTKLLSPSPPKTLYSPFNKSASEAMSVATSDDSGIGARPSSSASKSDPSLSRPESSTSNSPMRKSLSGSTDYLQKSDQCDRTSPLQSEDSKADNVSPLGRIDEGSTPAQETKTVKEMVAEIQPKTTIITVNANMNTNGLPEPNNNIKKEGTKTAVRKSSTARSKSKKSVHIEEKPWYDVSDDDMDMRSPDPITSIISVRGGSSEDDDPF